MRKTKQRIKSFLLYHGIEEPAGLANWTLASRKELFDLQLLPELRFVLRMLLKELAHQEGFLKRITAQLGRVAKTEKHAATIDYLCTVPGVGSLTAIAFRLEVFRPERFRKPEELACFLGLAPGVRQSGESSRGQGIMPSGQNRLRSMLIEAAWVWRRWDPTAAERYGKLLGKNGVSQKAITALARRLAIILWRLCLEQRAYQVVR
jgi:transposase